MTHPRSSLPVGLLACIVFAMPAICAQPPDAPRSGAASNAQPNTPERRKALNARHLRAALKWKSIVEAYVAATPVAQTDLAALADSLPKPQSAFEYVRDQIAFEPYPGAMKGAAATLITRGGNALDRALLLATLVSMQGFEVQIAHGQLSATMARNLLQQISTTPGAAELIARSATTAGTATSPARQKIGALSAADGKRLAASTEQSFAFLDASVQAAKIALGSDKSEAQLKSLQDHYWVRAVVDGKTLDLDPSFAAMAYGRKYAEVAETLNVAGLDAQRMQTMSLRLVADYLQGGAVVTENLLEGEFNTIDLWGQNIRLAVLAKEAKAAANDFLARLSIGGDTAAQKTFQLRVTRADKTGTAQGNGSPFAGLTSVFGAGGGTEAPNPKPSGAILARLYLEVETRGPELAAARSRRMILDRLDSSGGALRIDPALAGDEIAGAMIGQVWDGTIGLGPVHPVYLAKATLAWLASYIDLQNQLIAAADSAQKLDSSQLPGPLLAPELLSFYLSSANAEGKIQAQFTPQLRAYHERPRLAFLRHGFAVGDWSDLSKQASYREGIDVINAPFAFVGPRELQSRLAMRWGAADTALELRLNGNGAFNTLPLMAAASAAKVPVHTIGPDQHAMLASVSVPAPIKAVLEGELRDGHAILAPARLIDLNGTRTYGWWSVEKDTGYAIGKMELGGAQDIAEYTNLQKAIPKASQIAGNLMGNVLLCYMGAVSSVLASGAGASTADCLQAACCRAISKLLEMEAADSASVAMLMEDEEELSTIYKLLDAIMANRVEKASGNTAEEAGKAACEATG